MKARVIELLRFDGSGQRCPHETAAKAMLATGEFSAVKVYYREGERSYGEVTVMVNGCAESALAKAFAKSREKLAETSKTVRQETPKSILDLAGKKFSAAAVNGNFARRRTHP